MAAIDGLLAHFGEDNFDATEIYDLPESAREGHLEFRISLKFFGWETPDAAKSKALVHDAIDFLMKHIGDQIEAPPEAMVSFKEMNAEY